jgi:nucleotide-binding universal stress UspA family protein
MRVIIAADDISPEVASARAAAARPWTVGSSLCLLNVLDPYPFNRAPLFLDREKEGVLQNLDSASGSLRQAGWNTTTEIYLGSPRRGVNRFARDWKADLVMMGCNDVSDLTRLFLGGAPLNRLCGTLRARST